MKATSISNKQKEILTKYQEQDRDFKSDSENAFLFTYASGLNPQHFKEAVFLLEQTLESYQGEEYGLSKAIKALLPKIKSLRLL